MSELRPCPFCGLLPNTNFGFGCPEHTNQMSITEWQSRPLEDALQSENAKAQSIIDGLIDNIHDEQDKVIALQSQLAVAMKAMESVNIGQTLYQVCTIIADALSEIAAIGKEIGSNLTVDEEDGKEAGK